MPLTLVHEARTRDVLVKTRLAIDELLKDCPGAPLVITLQQLPGW